MKFNEYPSRKLGRLEKLSDKYLVFNIMRNDTDINEKGVELEINYHLLVKDPLLQIQ